MFRRVVGNALAKVSLAALVLFLNFRVPFLKLYVKISLAALALLFIETTAFAQEPSANCVAGCGTCGPVRCQHFHCPPALKWCMEGKPRICWQHGCPKPICNPCEAPNWGYYQKCWTPWPWPPDWSHCPVPPPASQVFPGMLPPGQVSQSDNVGPNPRRLDNRPPL